MLARATQGEAFRVRGGLIEEYLSNEQPFGILTALDDGAHGRKLHEILADLHTFWGPFVVLMPTHNGPPREAPDGS